MDEKVIDCFNSKEDLLSAIDEVKAEILQEKSLRDDRKAKIERDILNMFPGCEVYFFGSQVIGIATKKSDFDIYIDHDSRSYAVVLRGEDDDTEEVILKLAYKFYSSTTFKWKFFLPTAKVPLVQVIHMNTEKICDIICQSGRSVENSKLARVLLSSDYRVSWLVITVKWWMDANKLLDKHKFNSYSVMWLVFFFLMQAKQNVLKPVLSMKQGQPRHTVGGWDCRFDSNFYPNQHQTRDNRKKRIELLAEFFKYYETFDFENVVLCTLTGSAIPRRDFDNLKLPAELNDYVDMVSRDPKERLQTDRENNKICVQDPFELSHNITKVVKFEDLHKFQLFCSLSLDRPVFPKITRAYYQ